MTHVVCVGDVMVDVLAALPGPLAPNSDTPAQISVTGGGAAANVAAWLVAAGATSTLVGRVGDDVFGRDAVASLGAAGVATSVEVDATLPTGVCLVLVGPDGERTMIPSAGANGAGAPEIDPAWVADRLYLSGYTLLHDGSRASGRRALDHARRAGWPIAVDVASAAPLAALGPDTFFEWVGEDVLLFANAEEATVLTHAFDPHEAAALLGQRCGEAVITLGAAGAVWSDGTELRRVVAAPATVRDSTGAGDAFTAGFLAADGDIQARLTAAARLAATAVARPGARPQPRGRSTPPVGEVAARQRQPES